MRLEPRQTQARSDQAWAAKRPIYATMHECWRYAAPGLDPFRTSQGAPEHRRGIPDGSPRHDHLFDSTLMYAADKLANALVRELFPAGRDWGELEEGLFGIGESPSQEVREAIATTQLRLFNAIHASNFVLAVGSMAFDGVVSGTGCMKVGASPDSATMLEYDAVNQAEVAFERGSRNQVWGYYRKMHVEPSRIRSLWPDAENVPSPEKDERDSGKERQREILEASRFDPDDGLWRYDVLMLDEKGSDGLVKLFEREYIVSPWVSWRYRLAPGEVQGRSPVMAALPDARTANKVVETQLKAGALRAAGVFTYKNNDGFNPHTAVFEPGMFLPVGSNDSTNPTVRAMELAGDPQMAALVLEDLRASIRRIMLDQELPPPTGAVRSATEIIERIRQGQEELGPPFVRMQEEVARPTLRSSAYLLAEGGQLPELAAIQAAGPDGRPMPLMLNGRDVQVRFNSPLVRAQRLSDAETTIQWAEASRAVAGDAAFEASVKTAEIPPLLQHKMGAPPELIRSEEERAEMEEQNREAQLAQGMGGMPEMAPGAMAA